MKKYLQQFWFDLFSKRFGKTEIGFHSKRCDSCSHYAVQAWTANGNQKYGCIYHALYW